MQSKSKTLPRRILVTGGAGFIGSHLVRLFVHKYPEYRIVNFDALTYAGNLENLRDVEQAPNYVFERADITDPAQIREVFEKYRPAGVIHLAAESHVDRSISNPVAFVETNVLGTVNRGAAVLMSGLDLERLVLSGGPLGLMQAAFDYAVTYAHERKQFGTRIAEFQLIQGKIADMYTKLGAARSYVYAVGRACDQGAISRRDCAGAILYSSDRCVEVTTEAMQMLGGNGYTNDYPVARFWRDARLYTVGAGTQEIRRMLIARMFNEQLK